MKRQIISQTRHEHVIVSLLDNAPNDLIGCLIQKRRVTNTLKPWYNEPRNSEFRDIVNKTQLPFWGHTRHITFDIVNKKGMMDLFVSLYWGLSVHSIYLENSVQKQVDFKGKMTFIAAVFQHHIPEKNLKKKIWRKKTREIECNEKYKIWKKKSWNYNTISVQCWIHNSRLFCLKLPLEWEMVHVHRFLH